MGFTGAIEAISVTTAPTHTLSHTHTHTHTQHQKYGCNIITPITTVTLLNPLLELLDGMKVCTPFVLLALHGALCTEATCIITKQTFEL